ncbi:alpha/beta fold hydrolase [Chitinivorax sp. B]|uniref:thioesterase II family protein n=1 Tax=Chitinivorax sp. B TaxID=2502235 RepID=UPI0014855929|nr:alpha/beta fold hydrolase [Chitinivorax sp. B]
MNPIFLQNLHRYHSTPPTCVGFGYAGGNGMVFQPLAQPLTDAVSLAEFVMPGRGRRIRDAQDGTLQDICHEAVQAILPMGTSPILLGYSLGALLAYEVALMLTEAGMPPKALLVCAMNAPHQLPPAKDVHRMTLPALQQHLATMGGTPAEILADLELLACFAKPIQHDYRLIETYRPQARPLLTCPIEVLAGELDPETDLGGIAAWQSLTLGPCRQHWLPAGHFFIHSHLLQMADLLRSAISRACHHSSPAGVESLS